MTSLERIMAALGGQEQDRPPFTLTMSLYGSRLTDCPLDEYYSRSACYASGQQAVYELCRPDILFGPFALALEAAAFGGELFQGQGSPPFLKKPPARSVSDCLKLELPDIDSNTRLCFIRESISLLAARYKNSVPVCGIVVSPVDLPLLLMGVDAWLDTLINHPEQAAQILEKTGAHFVAWANAQLSDGASFIAVPMECVNPALLFRKIIKDTLLPAISAAFARVKGPIIFHHGGNRLGAYLADYLDLPNVAGFALDQRDSFDEARRIVGARRLLLGNINGPALHAGSDEQVLEKVRALCANRRPDPAWIFASSGADISIQTPPARVRAIADTVRGLAGWQ